MKPRLYLVHMAAAVRPVEVLAYSAEDAEYQVQMGYRSYTRGPAHVVKVEPAPEKRELTDVDLTGRQS
jgi:hypothetical protein